MQAKLQNENYETEKKYYRWVNEQEKEKSVWNIYTLLFTVSATP